MAKQSISSSFRFALAGIVYCLKKERNIKIHTAAAVGACLLAWFLDLSQVEFLILLLFISAGFVAEFINTAIEAIVDLVSPEFHELAKIAKDVAAGAVLLAAIASLIAGALLFLPKMIIALGG